MKVETSHRDGVAILHLRGTMHHGGGDGEFRAAFDQLLGQGDRHIVLDLEHVTSMDSSGLGELVRARASTGRSDVELRLASVPPRIYQLLEIAQLVPVFGLCDDVDAAVAELSASSSA